MRTFTFGILSILYLSTRSEYFFHLCSQSIINAHQQKHMSAVVYSDVCIYSSTVVYLLIKMYLYFSDALYFHSPTFQREILYFLLCTTFI